VSKMNSSLAGEELWYKMEALTALSTPHMMSHYQLSDQMLPANHP